MRASQRDASWSVARCIGRCLRVSRLLPALVICSSVARGQATPAASATPPQALPGEPARIAPDLRDYEWFHAHPELSHQERETAAYLANALQAMGAEVWRGVGGTGVVALIEGKKPGPGVTVLYRADMDESGVLFCAACADDAWQSGLFTTADEPEDDASCPRCGNPDCQGCYEGDWTEGRS